MTEPSTAPAPPYPTDFLGASPEELARRDPSRTAAEWAEAQAHTRAVWEAPAAPPPVVDREEDVPAFATEGEEADFWEEHQMGPDLERRYRSRRPPAPPKQPAPTSLRLEADTVRRLRALAAKKGTKYQTLLKQFVVERLYEEERREGLLAPVAPEGAPAAAQAG